MKFIKLESYDILHSRTYGSRIISTSVIKELVGDIGYEDNPITRVKLIDGDYIDVRKTLEEVKGIIEGD